MTDLASLFGAPPMPARTARPIPEQNQPFVRPGAGSFNTSLDPLNEMAFQGWLGQNQVPFDANAPVSDYDMRGFWQALQAGDPRAAGGVDPNDGRMHYPDYWKTPYHETFSGESQWAKPVAPMWNDQDQLVSPGQRILFDDRNRGSRLADMFGGS